MLADVVIMRIGLIFLLIGTHSFAPYSGSWDVLPNMEDVVFYKYISPFTHFISMPALIFISGYLFGHSWHRAKHQTFKEFIIKKFKRLIIPSIIFSGFYYFLFYDTTQSFSRIGYSIINGCGHLWFLPMLFWCFFLTFLLNKLNISHRTVISILIIVSILPIPTLPFRLSSTCSYLIYFYVGSVLQMGGGIDLKHCALWLAILTVFYFVLQFIYPEITLAPKSSIFGKAIYLFAINVTKMLLGFAGIGIAFIATRMFLQTNRALPVYIITLSTYCYGVYIFHQFMLKCMYYNMPLAEYIHPSVLPWVAFTVTLLLSLTATALLLRTKAGRYLIG